MSDNLSLELKSLISDKATHDQLKYWCKLLGVRPVVKARIAHITVAENEKLREMIVLISSGVTPKEAVRRLGSVKEESGHLVTWSPDLVSSELSELKKAVLSMAEKMNVIIEENRALRSEVSSLQKCLEYRKPEPSTHTAVSESLITTRKEEPPRRSAPPIRTATLNPARSLSLWESVQLYFNDISGFFLGRG